MENKGKICMFTGHRIINAKHVSTLPKRLDDLLEALIAEGYTEFRAGGAIGFDTVAALKILEKKRKYGFIKLHLFLPCHDQERSWRENARRAYYYVLKNADSMRYCSEEYYDGCMQKRNRQMVDGSDLCVAYCGSRKGGSAYTLAYAQKCGVKVVNLFS